MPTFQSPYFAIQPQWAHQLLNGPEARTTQLKTTAHRSPGAVVVSGVLGSASDWFADTSYEGIQAELHRAVADPQVKVIDLLVNSPGGACLGLPETADAIRSANRIKPVRATVTGVAASAAYWLASQAGTIRLTPSGEVGSVGVLDIHADVSKALEASGVTVSVVASSPEKIERAPFVPLSDAAREHMQASVNDWYGQFLGAVRRGRGARVSPTGTYGAGRMLSSKDALASGLVDFISGGSL